MRGLIKAQELLIRRGILSSLRSLELSTAQTQEYWGHLLTLQAVIFDLDYYGEENWVIEESVVNYHWRQIETAAERLAHKNIVTRWLEPMRSYQQIEIGIRLGIPVTTVPITKFYGLKSCDVRLFRNFLAQIASQRGCSLPDSIALKALDVIREVQDDVEDLIEDTFTYNGNRLISTSAMYGIAYTLSEYKNFILPILQDARMKCCPLTPNYSESNLQVWLEVIDTSEWLLKCLSTSRILKILQWAQKRALTSDAMMTAAA